MYEQHFGLNKRPFISGPTGNEVFVGPQTANTMSGLKKALASQDAVVAVSGPAGSGKTTLVTKALDALSGSHKILRIGRMQLQGTDALEFLLEELGVAEPPKGPIRQFAALRAQFAHLDSQNVRVVVVIEDALRTGAETLAELEALTAADAGDSSGAAIVVMGDDRLTKFNQDPQLARLGQRVRQRLNIAPLSVAELRAYLMHCFRLAGADFEFILDDRCAALVHELSGGIPRIANKIVDAALTAAASKGLQKVPAEFVAEIARDEFGLEAEHLDAPTVAEQPAPEAMPAAEPVAEPEPEQIAEPEVEPTPDPVIVFSDEPAEEPHTDAEDIPELIQDTLPDLEILAPEIVAAEEPVQLEDEGLPELPELSAVAEVSTDQEAASIPTLDADTGDLPEWERDPTLAELKPDLDALEKAMAFAQGDADEAEAPEPEAPTEPTPEAPKVEQSSDEIPEITLDNAIQARIEDSLIDEPGQVSATAPESATESGSDAGVPEVRIEPRKAKKADAEIEKIAAELAKAKTIEDVDDKLAETLFGEEINLIASQVVAAGAVAESANDEELALFDTAAASMAQAAGSPQVAGSPQPAVSAPEEPGIEVSLETRERGGEAGLDLSASQRLKTVRALNAGQHQPLNEAEDHPRDAVAGEPSAPEATPEPIEDQINTSLTQTLKALNVPPPVSSRDTPVSFDDDDDEDEKKGGFFSRFKRS
jgi:type II secretory pathway predicted ATPase ExeA